jgi:hypothetical protein
MTCAALPLSRAESAKTYQVTGPVVALTSSTITVEKNGENWEIARDASLKGDSALKVGDRVTVHYRMSATKIESKPGKGDASKDESTASAKKK